MRVLVLCEYSATVRDAFRARGHDAWSCDILPTEGDPTWHIRDDALHVLTGKWAFGWDLIIAHPPCTYLTYAGAKHLYIDGKKENGRDERRWENMRLGAEFFRAMLNAPADRIAVENPVMLAAARRIVGRDADQFIQPWMFGHPESKRTGLWLKGLPPLVPTKNVEAQMLSLPRKERDRIHYLGPGPNRWKERSRTYQGIAEAMAEQWGRKDRLEHQPSLFGAAA